MQSFKFRWKRWVAGAVGLVALYAAAGFWLVGFLIKDQLPKLKLALGALQETDESTGSVTTAPGPRPTAG